MQFKCSSCQAKYQIADEKVAGKTVRMKCRKCGGPIEVRARVTDGGLVAVPVGVQATPSPPPAEKAAPAAEPATTAPKAAPAPATAPGRIAPPRPPPAPPRRPSEPGAKPLGVAPGLRPFAPAGVLRPASAEGPDEDGGSTTILSRDLLGVGVGKGSSPGGPAPAAPRPAAGRRPTPTPAPAPWVPERAPVEPAAAPSEAEAPPAVGPAAELPDATQEEWFVGIAGRPVGPRPRAFLVERVAAGDVDASSLVWREDFTEWRPLGTVAELAPLLAARKTPAAVSPPSVTAPGAPTASEPAPVPSRSDPIASSKGPSVPPPAPSAPVALVRVKDEDAVAFDQGPAVLAASAASARSEMAPQAPSARGAEGETSAPRNGLAFAPASEEPRAGGRVRADGLPSEHDDEDGRSRRDRRRRSRGVKPVAWAFVAMAGAFGAVAAYVAFAGHPGPGGPGALGPTVSPTTPSTGASINDPGAPSATASTILLDPVSVEPSASGIGTAGPGGPSTAASVSSVDRPSDLDLSGFNTAGPAGPTAGPGSTAGSESRGELTSADISAVVAKYKGGVSRKCLPLVEAGGAGGATSARVVAHLLIGPSGDVQSASASGGKEFPGLADCVAARVRTWKFPASSGTTPVDVPFHFIAQ